MKQNPLKWLFFHAAVSCALACIGARILDWYNPFMDFWGQMWIVRVLLGISLFLAAVLWADEKIRGRKKQKNLQEDTPERL